MPICGGLRFLLTGGLLPTLVYLTPFALFHTQNRALSRTFAPSAMSFFGSGAATATAGQTNTTGDISKDVQLNQPPEDSISDMRFSPASDHLAVASWDKKVRIYEINEQGQSEGKAMFEHEAPVLNCCWSPVSFFSLSFIFRSPN